MSEETDVGGGWSTFRCRAPACRHLEIGRHQPARGWVSREGLVELVTECAGEVATCPGS